jgi:hypothetical protein
VLPPEKANEEASSGPMPDVLNALVAFAAEHQRCGDLDGGRDGGYIWLTRTPAQRSSIRRVRLPRRLLRGDSRK